MIAWKGPSCPFRVRVFFEAVPIDRSLARDFGTPTRARLLDSEDPTQFKLLSGVVRALWDLTRLRATVTVRANARFGVFSGWGLEGYGSSFPFASCAEHRVQLKLR